MRLPLMLFAALVLAQPAAALNADYWRGGWRTPLGDEPHLYQFVIRGNRVTGVYCRNCSDATTIGFIDGRWDEKAVRGPYPRCAGGHTWVQWAIRYPGLDRRTPA